MSDTAAPPRQSAAAAAQAQHDKILIRERRDDVYILTLNCPDNRNALSEAMIAAIERALVVIKVWLEVKVVIIAGAGPVFCSGHDLRAIQQHREDGDSGKSYYKKLLAQCTRLMTTMTEYPKPIIAAVEGAATAAGVQLIASCDLAVGSSASRYSTPGVNIGFFCHTPAVPLSRNLTRKHALEMLLTGEFINAPRALEMGLVNRVAAEGKALDEAIALGRIIAQKSPEALAMGKKSFHAQEGLPIAEAYAAATDYMVDNMLMADAAEGVSAFLGKRKPEWKLG
jgi:enoyl-CoA hydratase/carnithine racemase